MATTAATSANCFLIDTIGGNIGNGNSTTVTNDTSMTMKDDDDDLSTELHIDDHSLLSQSPRNTDGNNNNNHHHNNHHNSTTTQTSNQNESHNGHSHKFSSSNSSNQAAANQNKYRQTLEYLKELFSDRERLQLIPLGIFSHLARLLELEIQRVRASLIHIDGGADQREQLILPDPEGPVVQKSTKIYVPAEKYPDFNFIGRIIGPRGLTIRELEVDCGCKLYIRGKGSLRDKQKEEKIRSQPNWEHLNDELHVLIMVEDSENRAKLKLDRAVGQINKLFESVISNKDDFKMRQLAELAILNDKFNPKLKSSSTSGSTGGGGGSITNSSTSPSVSSPISTGSLLTDNLSSLLVTPQTPTSISQSITQQLTNASNVLAGQAAAALSQHHQNVANHHHQHHQFQTNQTFHALNSLFGTPTGTGAAYATYPGNAASLPVPPQFFTSNGQLMANATQTAALFPAGAAESLPMTSIQFSPALAAVSANAVAAAAAASRYHPYKK